MYEFGIKPSFASFYETSDGNFRNDSLCFCMCGSISSLHILFKGLEKKIITLLRIMCVHISNVEKQPCT